MLAQTDQQLSRETATDEGHKMPPWREVFLYFLFLGFVNVGGPVAQITMMFNHMVERRGWLTKDRFVKIMAFCHMLPGPEALQLAIYVGYLKRKFLGGILAGLTFIIPGAVVMIVLSWSYVTYGSLSQVNSFLYVLKPAVLGIIAAGIIKLGRAAIRNWFLAALLVAAFLGMRFAGINFLLILLLGGFANLLMVEGWPRLRPRPASLPVAITGLGSLFPFLNTRWFHMAWLFLEIGLFSFGGAYASLVFLQRGAVAQHHWLTDGQLLDGVALSVATPGPFMLFATFAGFLAGGFRGAIIATFFVFLPSFVFVLGGARYIEMVRDNRILQAFLTGVSAAVVGVIIVVSIDLIPSALVSRISIVIATIAFLVIVLLKVDVAKVAPSERFAAGLSAELAISIRAVTQLEDAVPHSDICITCTPSTQFFLKREHVASGTFVAAVGADNENKQELDPALLTDNKVVADLLEQCAAIGDLHHALRQNLMAKERVHAELGEIVAGTKAGRTSKDEIIIFDSTGMALQDVITSALVYEKAKLKGAGTTIALID